MYHLLDFTGEMCNLGLAALHGFGGCAMLGLARYVEILSTQRKRLGRSFSSLTILI